MPPVTRPAEMPQALRMRATRRIRVSPTRRRVADLGNRRFASEPCVGDGGNMRERVALSAAAAPPNKGKSTAGRKEDGLL